MRAAYGFLVVFAVGEEDAKTFLAGLAVVGIDGHVVIKPQMNMSLHGNNAKNLPGEGISSLTGGETMNLSRWGGLAKAEPSL